MKIILKQIFLLVIVLSFNLSLNASHVVGGYIKSKQITLDSFSFSYILYRDCNAIGISWPVYITIGVFKNGIKKKTDTLKTNRISITTLNTAKNTKALCYPPNTYGSSGYEEHTYKLNVNLAKLLGLYYNADSMDELVVSSSECCKGSYITTLKSPGLLYSDLKLYLFDNKLRLPINNTPELLSASSLLNTQCSINKYLDMGLYDETEFDSISYSLTSSRINFNTNEVYNSPYSYNYPLKPFCIPTSSVSCTPLPNLTPPRGFYFNSLGLAIFNSTDCSESPSFCYKYKEYKKINGIYKKLTEGVVELIYRVQSASNYFEPLVFSLKPDTAVVGKEYTKIIRTSDKMHSNQTIPDTTIVSLVKKWGNMTLIRNTPFRTNDTSSFKWTPTLDDLNKKVLIPFSYTDDNVSLKNINIAYLRLYVRKMANRITFITFIDYNNNGKKDSLEPIAKKVPFYYGNKFLTTSSKGIVNFKIEDSMSNRLKLYNTILYNSITTNNPPKFFKNDTAYNWYIGVKTNALISGTLILDEDSSCSYTTNDKLANNVNVATSKGVAILSENDGSFLIPEDTGVLFNLLYKNKDSLACNNYKNTNNLKTIKDSILDIGYIYLKTVNDLSINISANTARRDKLFNIDLKIKNYSKKDLSVWYKKAVKFYLPNFKEFTFDSCSEKVYLDSVNNIHYIEVKEIEYLNEKSIRMTFKVPLTYKTGDKIKFSVYADSNLNDNVLDNNLSEYVVNVMGPFDPNNKLALTSNYFPTTNSIKYRINFQNIGNDTAFNVVVKDTLSNFIKANSLSLLNASHKVAIFVENNIVTFNFNGCKLTPKSKNEALSEGFVEFSVNLSVKDSLVKINNKASIYFDVEDPIVTNTVELNTDYYTSVINLETPIICAENEIKIKYISHATSNNFKHKIELSDSSGVSFKTTLGYFYHNPISDTGYVTMILPADLKKSNLYKIRILQVSNLNKFVKPSDKFKVNEKLITANTQKYHLCKLDSIKIVLSNASSYSVNYNGNITTYTKSGEIFINKILKPETIQVSGVNTYGCKFGEKVNVFLDTNRPNYAFNEYSYCDSKDSVKLTIKDKYTYDIYVQDTLFKKNILKGNYIYDIAKFNKTKFKFIKYDSIGCKDTFYKNITVNLRPVYTATCEDSICPGSNFNVTIKGLNSYHIGQSPNIYNYLHLEVKQGTYLINTKKYNPIYIFGSDYKTGCYKTMYINAPVLYDTTTINAKLNKNTYCIGDSIFLNIPLTKDLYTIKWGSKELTKIVSGTYFLQIATGTNLNVDIASFSKNNCTYSKRLTTLIYDKTNFIVSRPDSICKNSLLNLTMSVTQKYLVNIEKDTFYKFKSGLIFSIPYIKNKTVNVIGENSFGCRVSKSITTPGLFVNPTAILTFSKNEYCENEPISIDLKSNTNCNIIYGTDKLHNQVKTGNYLLGNAKYPNINVAIALKSLKGCNDTFKFITNVNPVPRLNIVYPSVICGNVPFEFSIVDLDKYTILKGTTKLLQNIEKGKYTINENSGTVLTVEAISLKSCFSKKNIVIPKKVILAKPEFKLSYPNLLCLNNPISIELKNIDTAKLFFNNVLKRFIYKNSTASFILPQSNNIITIRNEKESCILDSSLQLNKFYDLPIKPIILRTNDTLYINKYFKQQWYFENGKITNVIDTNARLKIPKINEKYFVSVLNEGGCQNKSDLLLYASINKNVDDLTFIIENPFDDKITIIGNYSGSISYKMYNLNGKIVASGNTQNKLINTQELANGMYFLELNYLNKRSTFKVIKNKE